METENICLDIAQRLLKKWKNYFCHFMQRPSDYEQIISNDADFAKSDALNKIKWIVQEQEDIYVSY